ncbi:DUF421 domain-containing protein [Aquibacillus salsiterrae]|uniref:DUF421 domain-containing protein n=1 Tax=Aquibacillus salsiterrae TaxID=2950439 RepID=A0A9X3WCB5_9BACI|nr:DUF421 domain-containing protein [Aquibacillus salsiterrae]MDC3417182.1 DUF421 domain-containing protein [Aquibacillus salsiterrae]
MENAVPILVETLFGFIALFAITKILGKTQISQLTPFDFISGIIFGEIVGGTIYDGKAGVAQMAYAVFLWGLLLYITEWMTQRFKRTRTLLEGKPAIVIHKGYLQREAMKKNKLDLNQLLHLLRSKGAFSVREVDYAVLESDGTISILKKTLNQSPTRQDLNLMAQRISLPVTLIDDGEIIEDNLKEIKQDRQWLENELKKQKVNGIRDVFYAEYKEGEALFVQTF